MKETTKLFDLFEQYAQNQNYASAFGEMLDYFLIPFKVYEDKKKREVSLDRLATYEKQARLLTLLSEVGELSEGFGDPIGELYEKLISKGQHGQFFTPNHVADLMAACTITDKTRPGQTVCDPACGSGRMLLAAAKINRHLRFYGADTDPLCCKMALANMILNSLTGEIAHMNTLSNAFYRGYQVGTVLRNGYHHPYYREFAVPEESYIWQRAGRKK